MMKKLIMVVLSICYFVILCIPFYTDRGHILQYQVDENGETVQQPVVKYYKRSALERLGNRGGFVAVIMIALCVNAIFCLLALFIKNPVFCRIKDVLFIAVSLLTALALFLARNQTMTY